MRVLNYSFEDPAENLALEEVLLDRVEQGVSADILRFWESPVSFVVLGTAQVLAQEVHEEACAEDGVAIMRRCTAGGCVLQGPGCLNYSLFLSLENNSEVRSLHGSYDYILNTLSKAFEGSGLSVRHEGISDLAIGGMKVSGNAQRRRRRAILHHGTLLYQPDFAGMQRYLQEPGERPDYRGKRDHRAFVREIPLPADALRAIVSGAFGSATAFEAPQAEELEAARALAQSKYRDSAWIYRR